MMYRILLKDAAEKFLDKLDQETRARIVKKLEDLKNDPFPRGYVKVSNTEPPAYRVRIGKYRALYYVFKGELLITVAKIDTRSRFYDNI